MAHWDINVLLTRKCPSLPSIDSKRNNSTISKLRTWLTRHDTPATSQSLTMKKMCVMSTPMLQRSPHTGSPVVPHPMHTLMAPLTMTAPFLLACPNNQRAKAMESSWGMRTQMKSLYTGTCPASHSMSPVSPSLTPARIQPVKNTMVESIKTIVLLCHTAHL